LPPDADALSDVVLDRALQRIAHRIHLGAALRVGAAVTAGAAVLLALLSVARVPLPWSLVATIALAIAAWISALYYRRNFWTLGAAAAHVERVTPESRNVVVTAHELMDHPERARPWIRARVVADAARILRDPDLATLVPLQKVTLLFVTVLAALGLVVFMTFKPTATLRQTAGSTSGTGAGFARPQLKIAATVSPPAYTNVAARTLVDPDRIDAVEGSLIHLEADGEARPFTIRFGSAPLAVSTRGETSVADVKLEESGYLAFESASVKGALRLVPVSVTSDRAPTIRIENPGKDLLMPDGKATIPLAASATDDFGLQSLDLRYTKVSGSGEQFQFVEGTLPLDVTRESNQSWKGKGAIALGPLGLQPGDALVYRVVARDRRPGGGGVSSSDSFFIEVAGPGQVALEGFDLPPDRVRYALSQQMIVLKIQRLRAREAAMARDAVQQQTALIAAEQRAVRANFVFLMGGQVEDEEQEAEQSHEIQEGRLENNARREINTAIQYMSHAEQALVAVDSGKALPPAKSAVDALQRAFGRNRYFLRTLPVRSRVDPSRRLSGDLKEASGWRRDVDRVEVDRTTREARRFLSRLLALARTIDERGQVSPAVFNGLAEEALAVDPASPQWQNIARMIVNQRDRPSFEVSGGRDSGYGLVMALVEMVRKSAVSRDQEMPSALHSAWADEVRRR
jgi:hypothetical protein